MSELMRTATTFDSSLKYLLRWLLVFAIRFLELIKIIGVLPKLFFQELANKKRDIAFAVTVCQQQNLLKVSSIKSKGIFFLVSHRFFHGAVIKNISLHFVNFCKHCT